MQAMILAAGFGTRLRPYTLLRPKPLMPVMNQPLLRRVLDQVRSAGAEKIVVNAHHLASQITQALATEKDCVAQTEDSILGTGGGLKKASGHFTDGPVLISNADIFHDIDLAGALRYHEKAGALATLVLHDCPRFNKVLVAGGQVRSFDAVAASGQGRLLAFTGLHVIDPRILSLIPDGVFYDIIDCYRAILAIGGAIAAMVATGHHWTDIGTVADYLALHERLLTDADSGFSGQAGKASPFLVAADAVVPASVSFSDWASVGARAVIGEGARITRSVIWDGATVAPGECVTDAVVAC